MEKAKASYDKKKRRHRLLVGLAFLGPNIIGFAAFTLLPLILSFVLAFTDWDIKQHNMFTDSEIRFVGFSNFVELFSHNEFWKYLGNTLFLMLGVPFAIAGSLIAALLLTKELKTGRGEQKGIALAACGLVIAFVLLSFVGLPIGSLLGLIFALLLSTLVGGVLLGTNVYRTVYYLPHFTAGVATFLLWKQMYNPQTGPINNALEPVLSGIETVFRSVGSGGGLVLSLVALFLSLGLTYRMVRSIGMRYCDTDIGRGCLLVSSSVLVLTIAVSSLLFESILLTGLGIASSVTLAGYFLLRWLPETPFRRVALMKGMAGTVLPLLGTITFVLSLIAIGSVLETLPVAAKTGLEPPNWLADYSWAKPAIMIMALWMAVGSNNMILYIAGLTNIPRELYEAADIDGATSYQRFWNVTWPQLAPVTFFIFILSIINGLQGGFEMARAMTQGGPAGATTTLSYFVFIEGFETGRLGYASAVVWALFLMVFAVTAINFKYGNRYVND